MVFATFVILACCSQTSQVLHPPYHYITPYPPSWLSPSPCAGALCYSYVRTCAVCVLALSVTEYHQC
ncbi:hypothetical protein AG1IA_09643 [Rhizoctonia solani AG-1 IA]|uniref:Secreted protein n=1 Tax=Thanatephorus cucumeris (strain AG1-IA) TaxID=983506 RepID=L8WHY9_THACA|nr:hypothetical protein AG1IA_09643 [Rhizoctonia solani AG-1 IA]